MFLFLVVVSVQAKSQSTSEDSLDTYMTPPVRFAGQLGIYRDPLTFYNGKKVRTKKNWQKRRKEILQRWNGMLGKWPAIIENPSYVITDSIRKENFTQYTIALNWRADEKTKGYLLVPDVAGKKPAVLTVFYEPETALGSKRPTIAYAYELAKRGYVTLSLGTNYFAHEKPFAQYYSDDKNATVQPLSMLGYLAANAYQFLANYKEVDASKVGIIGFSYGSKWAMFASCLYEKFACAVWIDGGIVFDESRPNVNYWEPWYLGYYPPPWTKNLRKGVYQELRKKEMDLTELHVLMAPRPFLVSGGSEEPIERWIPLNSSVRVNEFLGYKNRVGLTTRPDHVPDDTANKTIWAFFDRFLKK